MGEPKTIKKLRYADGKLTFQRALRIGPPEYPGGPYAGDREMRDLEATVRGDDIRVVMKIPGGQSFVHLGKQASPSPETRSFQGEVRQTHPPVQRGRSDGMETDQPKKINGWKVKDGELVNETPKKTFDAFSPYGNLRTERDFGDSKLTIEFNVPPGGKQRDHATRSLRGAGRRPGQSHAGAARCWRHLQPGQAR